MAQNFRGGDREQVFLLPPDVREWLPPDHLAWFVIDAVAVMDLDAFYGAYRADGHGRPAYEPSSMVALLLYCWSRGTRSSRRIERACCEDIACRVIAVNEQPDHATIARFVERHQAALAGLFGEVLQLCADAGLASVGVIAVDGTKIAANANRDRNLSYEQIAKTIIDEQITTDQDETARFGARRGDELPEHVATTRGRQGWLRAARQQLDREREQRAEPIPQSRPERVLEAKRRLEEDLAAEHEINANYDAYRARGRMRDGRRMSAPSKPYTPPDTPAGTMNITDPDSRLVHGMRGWVQGYNAQAVCNENHVILAADVITNSADFGSLGPMITQAREELAAVGVLERPNVVLADAGYWHLQQMNDLTGDGIPVLIPPDSTRRKNTRPGWDGGAYTFMRTVLDRDDGRELYKQRGQLIEPIFGHTKHNRGFTRFHRRGRAAARTEWRLMATTHNLQKLHKHFTTDEN